MNSQVLQNMVNIFQSMRYALSYEQFNLDSGEPYRKFAKFSLSLVDIIDKSKVLDLGCGSGISTFVICDNFKNSEVVGIDRSEELLKLANLKFGYINPDPIFKKINENHPYPKVLRNNIDVKNLETYLRNEITKNSNQSNIVKFYCQDASKLSSLSLDKFDYVLANQFIHWPRKENSESGPNLDYEKQVLQGLRDNMKVGGQFIFNTTGADYEFEDQRLNDKHLLNHPFYIEFMKSFCSQIGLPYKKERTFTFNHKEINKIMKENGFMIRKRKRSQIEYIPSIILGVCLIGGHMQLFQKENLNLTEKEREKILEQSVKNALKKSSI